MKKNNFTDKDKQKVVDFLNFVASQANFKLNTKQVIEYFGLLSFMQKELLPKIGDHIFEITKVIENPEESE